VQGHPVAPTGTAAHSIGLSLTRSNYRDRGSDRAEVPPSAPQTRPQPDGRPL